MGLIGKARSDRADMLKCLIEKILTACPEDAELGIAGGALEGLHLAICTITAEVSAPLVQAVLRPQDDCSATFVISLKHACSELPDNRPLRQALVDLDSHAHIFGTTGS